MSDFPYLFQLPAVPRTWVLHLMDPDKVIELTFRSKAIKRTVSLSKLKASKFKLILYNPPCNFIKIVLEFGDKFSIVFSLKNSGTLEKNAKNEQFVIQENFQISKFQGEYLVYCGSENSYDSQKPILDTLVSHFHEILKFEKYDFLAHDFFLEDLLSSFIWRYSKKFENFVFSQSDRDTVAVDFKDLKFLLEDLTVENMELSLRNSQNPGGAFDLKHLKMNLNYSECISFSTYLNLKTSEDVRITVSTVTTEEIVEFLNSWIEGNLGILKMFSVEMRNDIFDEDAIFKEFEDFGFEFPLDHSLHNLRPNIKDIRRPKDGKIARIKISLRKFEFKVLESPL